ncbi:MAG: hypothetical protein IPN77_11145 [Sandaracinaceae bacterium]|nr:hypothetical protein [Sandaracinaceae bacterium]
MPTCVHSKPVKAITSGSVPPALASALHSRTDRLDSRHRRGVSISAWSVSA